MSKDWRPDSATGTSSRMARQGDGNPWAWVRPKAFWGLLRATAGEWSEDKVPRLGAALAFYSVLSIAPLLLIAIAIAATVFGREAASGQIVEQIRGLVGKEGAEAVQAMLRNAQKPGAGLLATFIGFVTLLSAASGVFGQLQDAMNTIWEVQPKEGRGILGMLKDRFFSFAMVLGTGFLLLTSLILSTAVVATFSFLGGLAPAFKPLLQVGDFLVSGRRRHAALRADLQAAARCPNRLARRLGRRGADDDPVPRGQGVDRGVSGAERVRLGLRCGWFAGRPARLDLLFVADPVLWRRIHESLCRTLREPDRALGGRRAGDRTDAGPTGHPQRKVAGVMSESKPAQVATMTCPR